jgi:hypothetical protein
MMNIMDASGHKQLTWGQDDAQEIAQAKDTFDRLVNHGYSAFGTQRSNTKHLINDFDSTAEEIVLVPRIVSG